MIPALQVRAKNRLITQTLNLGVKVFEELVLGHFSVLIEKLGAQSKCSPGKQGRNCERDLLMQILGPIENLFI